MKKIFLSGITFLVLLSFYVSAATINAASCSYNDVQAAVNAAQSGETVQVPAGSCTWNNNLVITKGIYLIGAGIDQTIINNGYTKSGSSSLEISNNLVSFVPAHPEDNPPFRLSGMTFNFGTSSYGIVLLNPTLYDCTKIRIDHIKAEASGFVFQRYGLVHGCMDNCALKGRMDGGGPSSLWTYNGYEFGTNSNFYIEDCNWTYYSNTSDIFAAGNGPFRYAFRYNTITTPTGVQVFPLFDQHGNQPSAYSCMGAEIYDNTINLGTSGWGTMIYDQRGGKSLVYNNAITWVTSGDAWLRVREEYQDSDNPPATNGINGQPQHISDSYYWRNTENGIQLDTAATAETLVCSTCGLTVPTENIHFWNQKSNFNGTVGMGVGLFSARPTTCTVGVGYWANDTKTLYKCNSTNTWIAYYTPYTYPHPFRTDCTNYPGLCDSGPSQPEAYWVSPTGTSAWANCQSATPLSGASACSLTTANSNAVAGNTIYLRGGTYSGITGSAINPSNTGTAGNIITFSSYNGEDVQLIGSGTSSIAVNLDSQCWSGGNPVPCAITRNYIKVHDLHFSNFNRHLWIRFGSHNEISYCSFIGMPSDTSNLDWSASYIYRNAYYNWVHHSTFADYGKCEPYGTDYGVVFQVGVESLLDSDVSNGYLTKYNLVENNEMYHGGHHVVSFNGINNVFRNNSFRNDPWCPLSNPQYATRTYFQTGVPGDGQYNLVEGNRIGYGGPKNKIEIGGAGGTIAGAYNIWRRNIFMQVYTDAMWVTFYPGQDHVQYNKIYNNDYWHGGYGNYQRWPDGTVPSNYWSDSYSHAICIGENDEGSEVYGNAIKNNIFYDNLCLQGENLSIIRYYPYVVPAYQEIANNWNDNAADPKFVDISGTPDPTLIATQFDFHLQSDSPCIDQGGFLTTITSSSGSGTQFQVADAGYFMDGWGIIEGDMLQLQGQTARARIVSIDYSTNRITVDTPLSWTSGLGVSLAYEGSAPDIGAYESSGSAPPQCVAADVNCDGSVNLTDLKLVAQDFGKTSGLNNAKSDTNSNGLIDIFDVIFIASRFT